MFKPDPFERNLDDVPEEVFAWLDGHVTPEVDATIKEWLRISPDNRTILSELQDLWVLTPSKRAPDGWNALEERIKKLDAPVLTPFARAQTDNRSALGWALRAAAVLAVGIGIGMLWPRLQHSLATPQLARVVVPAGSQTEVVLPGGVAVRLNYASEMEYMPSANVREISLKGEAYIAVPEGAAHNLIVKTEAGIVRDLGTEFNVRARDGMTSVVVTKGKVQLGTDRGQVTLQAGQESSVAVGGGPSAPTAVEVEQELGWMSRRLTFYDQPIAQVAQELEYRYGVVFQVTDPDLRATRITAKIAADAGAKDAAGVICLAVQARCTWKSDRWVISPR